MRSRRRFRELGARSLSGRTDRALETAVFVVDLHDKAGTGSGDALRICLGLLSGIEIGERRFKTHLSHLPRAGLPPHDPKYRFASMIQVHIVSPLESPASCDPEWLRCDRRVGFKLRLTVRSVLPCLRAPRALRDRTEDLLGHAAASDAAGAIK